MNYLGHLFFSNDELELMYANIYGDFVKGSELTHLPLIVQKGVKLHRTIDYFIDSNPLIKDLRSTLSQDLPKISGIAIDLYFDHLLAESWEEYRNEPIEVFTEQFHEFNYNSANYTNPHFLNLISVMKSGNWLNHYQYTHGLEFASRGLSQRISFSNDLWKAPEIFVKFRPEIESVFSQFMLEAINYFKEYHKSIIT